MAKAEKKTLHPALDTANVMFSELAPAALLTLTKNAHFVKWLHFKPFRRSDRERASFVYVYMRCARDVLERERERRLPYLR
jgi:hypothetical protein